MNVNPDLIQPGDTVVFESAGVRCEAKVTEREVNLGHLWLYVRSDVPFESVPLKGCKRHSIPWERVIEHRKGIIVPPQSRIRTRARPAR